MSIAFESFDVETLRKRLRKMPDAELLKFIEAARRLCSDKNPLETFVIQLREARVEWLRRHPKGAALCWGGIKRSLYRLDANATANLVVPRFLAVPQRE